MAAPTSPLPAGARANGADRDEPITRADIESKLRQITGEVGEVGSASKGYVLAAGIVALTAVVAGAYLLGRRRGKRRTTVVEVRRV